MNALEWLRQACVLATVIVSGTASDSLADSTCAAVSAAHERQDWTAYVVREPWSTWTLYGLEPRQPFSFNLTVSAAEDTYTVVAWGRNSAGPGCHDQVLATSHDVVGVGQRWRPMLRRPGLYDVMGRRVRPPLPSGWYSDTVVVR